MSIDLLNGTISNIAIAYDWCLRTPLTAVGGFRSEISLAFVLLETLQ